MNTTRMGEFDDDNPEWTATDFGRADRASRVIGKRAASALIRKRGRPALEQNARKKQITIRLDPELLVEMRATGPGWQTRVEGVLKRAVRQGKLDRKSKKDA